MGGLTRVLGALAWLRMAAGVTRAFVRIADRPRDKILVVAYFAFYLVGKVLGRALPVTVPVQARGLRFLLRPGLADHVPLHEVLIIRSYMPDPTWVPASGASVVDLGANIGAFTVFAACAVGPSGRVIAVEPHAPHVRAIGRNLAANRGAAPVSVVCAAAWGTTGRGRLVRDSSSESEWRIQPDLDGPIPLTTLDDLTADLPGRVDLLKVDIEGGEVEAFRGADRTLERTDRVVVECHSRGLRAKVERLLSSHGLIPVFARAQSPEVAVVGFRRTTDDERTPA
jgi:FkbM family methyltransferase